MIDFQATVDLRISDLSVTSDLTLAKIDGVYRQPESKMHMSSGRCFLRLEQQESPLQNVMTPQTVSTTGFVY